MEENIQDVLNTAVESASSYGSGDSGQLSGTLLEKWFMPGNVEQRQFGQQIALQQMQNEWNSEGAKMKRMIDAGINPLTAAGGVSQSGQSGASGLTPQQSEGVSAGEAAQGLQAVGDVVDKLSSAKERDTLLNERRKNLINDTYLKWVTAGKTELESKSLAVALAYLPAEKYLGVLTLQQNMENLRAQHIQILQQVDESKKRIEQIDTDIELAHAQRDYTKELQLKAEKEKELIISQTTEQNWLNGVRKEYGIDPRSPIENNVLMTGLRGGKDYDTTLGIIHDTEYNRATGAYEAEGEHAYNIEYNKQAADLLIDWDREPRTMFEFISKKLDHIHEKLRNFRNKHSSAPSSSSSDSVSNSDLYQSWLDFDSQRHILQETINLMKVDRYEKYGTDKVKGVDMDIEIRNRQAELDKLPKTFKEFKKYVRSH